jgi:hypothetical protein
MVTEQAEPRANRVDSTAQATDALTDWGPPLAIATAVVFFISSLFPLVAGLARDTSTFPRWWGILDVGIAFILAALAIALIALAQRHVARKAHDATYRAYRILIHGLMVLMIVFLLFGDRIVWTNCLPGFAWRTWLLLYAMPAWFTAFRATDGLSDLPWD